jgi:sialate O-acetylesterase
MQFKNPEMPFYYVQLSSINRTTWGEFRDSQRKLLTIPYTGMAVCSDIGHPTDVHPKEKWEVGKRLSSIALAKSYAKNIACSGPLFDYANIINDKIEIYFKFSDGLKTNDGKEVSDIQIAGDDRVFVTAKVKIEKNKLIIWANGIKNPRYVKYGYTPFTIGNLINKYNLPASTFSNFTD